MAYVWQSVLTVIIIILALMFCCVVGEPGGGEDHDSVWKHRVGTVLISYVMFIGVGIVVWNNTINTTLNRINKLCDTVDTDTPCSRIYVLALFAFSVARSLFLIVAGLVVVYFASQMINIMAEYTPPALHMCTDFFRCISYTDYTFRAVEPATLPVHATAVLMSLLIAVALTLFFLTDQDLQQATVVRRKLTYMIIVIPSFMLFVYFSSCVARLVR